MFSRRLRPVSLSSSVLDGVKNYTNPGDWNKNTRVAIDFKVALKAEMNNNQQGRCVYCERLLAENCPEIEHIAPKAPHEPTHRGGGPIPVPGDGLGHQGPAGPLVRPSHIDKMDIVRFVYFQDCFCD